MHLRYFTPFAILLIPLGGIRANPPAVDAYNVVWESPSPDATGQMPLGNGHIAAGVYAIEDDALYLLLAANDALTYNGDIFKTGRVKVTLSPNPFAKGSPYRQTLDLRTGSIRIEADGVRLKLWADANRPLYHVEVESPQELAVAATFDPWPRIDHCGYNRTSAPIAPPTQDVVIERKGALISYFAVGDRSVYPHELKYYGAEKAALSYPDPYRFNTFGNLLESPQLKLEGKALRGSGRQFDIRIHARCRQEPEIEKWLADLEAAAARPVELAADWQRHCAWWEAFWNRSWIAITDNTVAAADRGHLDHEGYKPQRESRDPGAQVAQSYNVFRYLMACQSRGRVPAKFNGGLFTQPLRYDQKRYDRRKAMLTEGWTRVGDHYLNHEDERLWGRRFTFQNQRLLYWPLLMSGDSKMMRPFFHYYSSMLHLRRTICQAWFGHGGAYFRENIEPTGGERDCAPSSIKGDHLEDKPRKTPPGGNTGDGHAHSYYFTSGLELVTMMIEYGKFIETDANRQLFRDQALVPMARDVLRFYDLHYPRDADGKLRLDPAQSLESWRIAVNPSPDIAGLLHNLDELLAMEAGSEEDKADWKRLRAEIPEVPLREIEGRQAIAPAEEFAKPHNAENSEFYPVFPFPRFGLMQGTQDIVEWTMKHRRNVDKFDHGCWTQDQIVWALAGNAAEAKDGLDHRFRRSSVMCRFPLYGEQKPDSCPDLDHFGAGAIALQRMLVQEAHGKIHLLPAWPKEWDCNFKLHLTAGTTIQGRVKAGKLLDWSIAPESRAADVVVGSPQ